LVLDFEAIGCGSFVTSGYGWTSGPVEKNKQCTISYKLSSGTGDWNAIAPPA
jgi:hypothetical protein